MISANVLVPSALLMIGIAIRSAILSEKQGKWILNVLLNLMRGMTAIYQKCFGI